MSAKTPGRSHVHAPSGLRDDEHTRMGVDLTTDDEFLKIASGQRLRHGVGACCPHIKTSHQPGSQFARGLQIQPAPTPHRLGTSEQGVVRQAQAGHRTATQSLFGHKVQAQVPALTRTLEGRVFGAQPDRPRGRTAILTRQSRHELLLTVARDTCQT